MPQAREGEAGVVGDPRIREGGLPPGVELVDRCGPCLGRQLQLGAEGGKGVAERLAVVAAELAERALVGTLPAQSRVAATQSCGPVS